MRNFTYTIQERLILSQQFAQIASGGTCDESIHFKLRYYISEVKWVAGWENKPFFEGMVFLLKDSSFPVFTSEKDLELLLSLQNDFFPNNDALQTLLQVTKKMVYGRVRSFYDILIDYFKT